MLLRLLCFNRNLSLELLYSFPFLLQDWLPGFPGLFTDSSELIHFCFFTFQLLVLCGRLIIKLTSTSFSARVKTACRIVLYRCRLMLFFHWCTNSASACISISVCLSVCPFLYFIYLFLCCARNKQNQIHCHNLLMKTQHAANRTRINREKTLKQKAETSFTVLASDIAWDDSHASRVRSQWP